MRCAPPDPSAQRPDPVLRSMKVAMGATGVGTEVLVTDAGPTQAMARGSSGSTRPISLTGVSRAGCCPRTAKGSGCRDSLQWRVSTGTTSSVASLWRHSDRTGDRGRLDGRFLGELGRVRRTRLDEQAAAWSTGGNNRSFLSSGRRMRSPDGACSFECFAHRLSPDSARRYTWRGWSS